MESWKEKWENWARKKKAENMPNLMNGTNLHMQENQWSPHIINLKQSTPRHISVKLSKKKKKGKVRKKSWKQLEKSAHCLQQLELL